MKTQKTTYNSKKNPLRVITSLTLSGLLTTASICLAQTDTWTAKSPLPTARTSLSTSAVDGKIYAIGGRQISSSAISTVEQYDPVTDTWTTRAPMPTARHWLSTSAINGKIYAFGGTPGTFLPAVSTVEEYDPATDTWTEKAPVPTARFGFSTSVVDGKIYVTGGAIRETTAGAEPLSYSVEVYDPATDTWTEKAPMPTARILLATSVVNGKIYVIGGATAAGQHALSTVEEYDPAMNTWTEKAPIPTARATLSASAVNGIIYVIGGVSGATAFSTVEAYDPTTDTWTEEAPMPTARTFLSASAVNGKIYAIGGSLGPPWNGISTVEEYDTGLRSPSPDFNGDGLVDIKDLLRLIESWGQDDPMCDIAPPPFGDGIVDAMDLELLMSYWEQPVDDTTLIAHWALDEAEGNIAVDSISENGYSNGYVFGDPLWQPDSGQVNDAIQLDGVDDYIITSPVLNPADGPFSVLTWIRGGAAGQAIISELGSANWLSIDPLGGYLMTELTSDGRSGAPLLSETIITDGDWHRICFVWNGSNRMLYVDSIAVAQDMQDGLKSSFNGLYIGTGNGMAPGTYWSGLIDDVRIYNRAVSP